MHRFSARERGNATTQPAADTVSADPPSVPPSSSIHTRCSAPPQGAWRRAPASPQLRASPDLFRVKRNGRLASLVFPLGLGLGDALVLPLGVAVSNFDTAPTDPDDELPPFGIGKAIVRQPDTVRRDNAAGSNGTSGWRPEADTPRTSRCGSASE